MENFTGQETMEQLEKAFYAAARNNAWAMQTWDICRREGYSRERTYLMISIALMTENLQLREIAINLKNTQQIVYQGPPPPGPYRGKVEFVAEDK